MMGVAMAPVVVVEEAVENMDMGTWIEGSRQAKGAAGEVMMDMERMVS